MVLAAVPAIHASAYQVEKGDSLWGIATTQLGDGHRWPCIAAVNQLSKPNEIEIGQELVLNPCRGKSALGITRGKGRATAWIESQQQTKNHENVFYWVSRDASDTIAIEQDQYVIMEVEYLRGSLADKVSKTNDQSLILDKDLLEKLLPQDPRNRNDE